MYNRRRHMRPSLMSRRRNYDHASTLCAHMRDEHNPYRVKFANIPTHRRLHH